MIRYKRSLVRITWGAGALLALLIVFLLVIPFIVDTDAIRLRTLAELSRRLNGTVEAERLGLSFFPRPRVTATRVKIAMPERVDINAESITALPRILPLFSGRVAINRIESEAPLVIASIPKTPPEKEAEPFSLDKARESLKSAMERLAERLPNLKVGVRRGEVRLLRGDGPPLRFERINGEVIFPPRRFTADLSASSVLGDINLNGWLDSQDLRNRGHLKVTRLEPLKIAEIFDLSGDRELLRSRIDLDLGFQSDKPGVLQVNINRLSRDPADTDALPMEISQGRITWEGERVSAENLSGKLGESELSSLSAGLAWGEDRFLEIRSLSARIVLDQLFPWLLELGTLRERLAVIGSAAGVLVVDALQLRSGLATPGQAAFQVKGSVENLKIETGLVPAPLEIAGGRWEAAREIPDAQRSAQAEDRFWKGTKIFLTNLEGRMGDASVSGVTAVIGGEPPRIEATSAGGSFRLDQIHAWLANMEGAKSSLEAVESLEGRFLVRSIDLNGPLMQPALWNIGLNGNIEGLVVGSSRIPAPLSISGGGVGIERRVPDRKGGEAKKGFLEGTRISLRDLAGAVGKSSFSNVSGGLGGEPAKIEITSGGAKIDLGQVYSWMASMESAKGAVESVGSVKGLLLIQSLGLNGPMMQPAQWDFAVDGAFQKLVLEIGRIPAPLSVSGGKMKATRETISFENLETASMDAALQVSGKVGNYMKGPRRIEAGLEGSIGPEAAKWVSGFLPVQGQLKVLRAMQVNDVRIAWGEPAETLLSGKFAMDEGTEIAIDLKSGAGVLSIGNLHLTDKDSDFTMTLNLHQRELGLSFKGNLNQTTVSRLLVENVYLDGSIEGDLKAEILFDRPAASKAEGMLRVEGLRNPWKRRVPVSIESALLRAEGKQVKVDSSRLVWGKNRNASLLGTAAFSEEGVRLDLDLVSAGFDYEEWIAVRDAFSEGKENGKEGEGGKGAFLLRGAIRLKPEYFGYQGYTWRPAEGRIEFLEEGIKITTEEAYVCGIRTPVEILTGPGGPLFDFRAVATGHPFQDALSCFLQQEALMTGHFNMDGKVTASGEAFVDSLQGKIELTAEKGRIFRFGMLAKIFSVVNITEIIRGRVPDLSGEGLPFENIIARVAVEGSSILLEEVVLRGPSMDIFCIGSLNLLEKTLDLTVTVAPLRTVDAIVRNIPLVGRILGGTLISLPVRVTGDMRDPTVNPISPSAVGERMLGIMERTLKLPFHLIEPLIPQEEKAKEKKR